MYLIPTYVALNWYKFFTLGDLCSLVFRLRSFLFGQPSMLMHKIGPVHSSCIVFLFMDWSFFLVFDYITSGYFRDQPTHFLKSLGSGTFYMLAHWLLMVFGPFKVNVTYYHPHLPATNGNEGQRETAPSMFQTINHLGDPQNCLNLQIP